MSIYLSTSGANLSIKPIAGPSEKIDRDRILNLKVSPKIPIYSKGQFAYWEVPKSCLPLIYTTWEPKEILVDKKAQDFVNKFLQCRVSLDDLDREELTVHPLDGRTLRPNQIRFAGYSYQKENILILDDTGSGKCLAMLMRLANKGFKRLLVFTTKNNWDDWERECRAALGIQPVTYTGTPKQRKKIDLLSSPIVLANYEQAKNLKDHPGADAFDAFIMDEGHLASNPKSTSYKLMEQIIRLNKGLTFKCASTATPWDSDLTPFWGLINLIEPLIAGSKDDFLAKFQEPTRWREVKLKNGYIHKEPIKWKTKNIEEFAKLLKCIAHVSTAEDAAKDFIFKDTTQIIPMDMTSSQWDAYQLILDGIQTELDNGTFYEDNPMVKCGKLFRVAEGLFDLETGNHKSTKHDWTVDFLNQCLKEGNTCAVWSASLDSTEALYAKFKDHAVIYNGQRSFKYKKLAKIAFAGAKDKEEEQFFYENCELVKDFPFRTPGSVPFWIGVAARRAAEGINLPRTDRQIISCVNLSGRVTRQVIGRIKRSDTKYGEIFTKYPVIENTIDAYYVRMVLEKMSKVKELIKGVNSKDAINAREIVKMLKLKPRKAFEGWLD